MEKILIIGDTHGDTTRLLKVIEIERPTIIIHTGDYNNWSKNPKEIVLIPKNIIAKFDHYIEGNHGILIKTNNHDDFINQYRNDYKIIKINQKNILLCHSFNLNVNDIHHHGEKSDYVDVLLPFRNELIKNNNIDIVICGHTHNAYIQQRQDLLIINPGSLIYKNHLNQNTYVVGETTENGIDFVIKEYNL